MRGKTSIRLENVGIDRGGKTLISGLNLDLAGPKLLWVVGGNGIGKTSLLRSCAGLSRPALGQISWQINARPVTAPQAVAFLPTATYSKAELSASEDAAFWSAGLGETGLTYHGKTLTRDLSTGQIKRLSIAYKIQLFGQDWDHETSDHSVQVSRTGHRQDERFLRLLNRMLFRAAKPEERYTVLQRFYGLNQGLIERFYAGTLTWRDKARILIGKPPVPVSKALYNFSERAFIKRERQRRESSK